MKTTNTFLVLTFMVMMTMTTSLISSSNGANQNGQYLAFAEVMPAPIGGIAAIVKTIEYPEMARRSKIEGKVYVLAHINENGVAEEVKVIRCKVSQGC